MKFQSFSNLSISFCMLLLMGFISCGEKEDLNRLTAINLSNASIYEKLPQETNVATLSTNVVDNSITFRLISGEGDTNNNDFEIKGTILRTKKILLSSDGNNRSIRIQASNGTNTFEQALIINLNKFEGTYPNLSSSSFENNGLMPKEFGADFGNISPDLIIADIPSNTTSMALTMIDLDDGNNYHWVVWNIPPNQAKIAKAQTWGNGTVVGDNNFGTGYTGPFPPSVHRYKITVYFLNTSLDLASNEYISIATTLPGKIIAQASIIGRYQ